MLIVPASKVSVPLVVIRNWVSTEGTVTLPVEKPIALVFCVYVPLKTHVFPVMLDMINCPFNEFDAVAD